MQIDDGGSSAEAARRAAEEAARRAAEEAARKAREEAARAAAAQAAADQAAEEAFQARMNHPVDPPPAPPAPPPPPPRDVMEAPPPMNRIFADEIAAAQAETAALGAPHTAQSYRVDPNGMLVPEAPAAPTSEQRAAAEYDALPAAEQVQISLGDFVAQRVQEYDVVAQAQGQAALKVDAQITAALDDQGPGSREAAILRSQRDRLIQSQTRTALGLFRDTRDAAALADTYTEQPDRWQAAAAQMGLDPSAAPDPAAIKEFLQLDRKLDQQAQIAGQIAVNNLPPGATEADRAAVLAQAAVKTRLDGLTEHGALSVPEGADAQAWREDQAELAGEAARVRQAAIAAGQDPDRAVAQSDRLYDLQLETGLDSGSIRLEGATPEQVAAWKAQQVKRFQEAVSLANANGLDMAEAQSRIGQAYALQDHRIAAQLEINAAIEGYNASTTAVQRGGEAIRGFVFGDGVNHLQFAQEQIGEVEALERQYQQILLGTKGDLTEPQLQELALLKQQIHGQIDLTVANAGVNVAHSQAQAAMYKPVESALFGAVYTGASFLPGGVVIGATVKLLLDDLPNGRIRSNGNVWETSQDVALSMALGAGSVAVGKLDPTRGGTTTLLRAGANPLLERAAQVGLESAVGALWAGGASVGNQVLDANRDPGRAIDWQQAGQEALAGLGGGAIGGWAGRAMPVAPGNVAQAIFRDTAVGFASSSIVDASMQYATTGQVDARQSVLAGVQGAFDSALGGATAALGERPPRPTTPVPGPRPPVAAPPTSGITPRMQAALQDAMQRTGVARLGIRPTKPDAPAWHGVGGDTRFAPDGATVLNPGLAAAPETAPQHFVDGRPVTLGADGRPAFPAGPIDGNTGALYPTKPGGAEDLTLDQARELDARLRAEGTSLTDAVPALEGFYAPDGSGEIVAQQLALGSVRPVVQDDGTVAAVASDLDLAHAIGADGKPLTPQQVETILVPAIRDAYGAGYPIVNHGAHADGILDPLLNQQKALDADRFWNEPVMDFSPLGGYTGTRPFHETFLSHYAPPGFVRGPVPGAAGPDPTAAGIPAELRDRFLAASAQPGMTSWNAVITALGGTPVERRGMQALGELNDLGYDASPAPRPGDVALFVEEVPIGSKYPETLLRHAAIVTEVGPELAFLSANLTRATRDAQVTEPPGVYTLSQLQAQDPAIGRTMILYASATSAGTSVGTSPLGAEAASGLPRGAGPIELRTPGRPRVVVDDRGVRLANAGGEPLPVAAAGDAVADLLLDPRNPLLATTDLAPGAPPRPLGQIARDYHEAFYGVYYDPRTGHVRLEQVAAGDDQGVAVSREDIDRRMRLGEIPLAGVHNHPFGAVAPSGSGSKHGDLPWEALLFAELRQAHDIEFRSFILRTDEGRIVLTEFGGLDK